MSNYFARPEISNSNFKALKNAYGVIEDRTHLLKDVFAFGSLVDAFLTEPWRASQKELTLQVETGELVTFDHDVFLLAKRLANKLKTDRVVSHLINTMIGQYVFARTISFNYEATDYEIKGRCKFDGYSKKFATGVDYKTTACTSLSSFVESIEFFDYDQAGAFYMDLGRIDRFWIIGISKKNEQIFKYAIERNDATYKRGLEKYSKWAYNWITLIDGFKPKIEV